LECKIYFAAIGVQNLFCFGVIEIDNDPFFLECALFHIISKGRVRPKLKKLKYSPQLFFPLSTIMS
jgi:hypothetical protein